MKIIIGLIVVLNFCLTQTAMVSGREDALGIWISSEVYNVESKDLDVDNLNLHIDFKTEGFEIGLDYNEDSERLDFGLASHAKYDNGINFWFGIKAYDVTEELTNSGDRLGASFGIYTNDSMFFTVNRVWVSIDGPWGLDYDYSYSTVEIGTMIKVANPLVIGLSYIASPYLLTDLDEGSIKVTLGVTPF